MTSTLITDFCKIYQDLNKDNLALLGEVYSNDIEFTDPIHRIQGLDALNAYFANLYENMAQCTFKIEHIVEQSGQACITWQMVYRHHKINKGAPVSVNGCSHLQFSDKIDMHRDYLDLGEMLYEQLPVLGSVIKKIKQRAGQ